MSSNVYREDDTPIYEIPNWTAVKRWTSPSGLAVEEWHKQSPEGRLVEIAVVFQGTNFKSVADWRTNLSLIEPRQHREAIAIVKEIRDRAAAEEVRVVATGHSLGGALALNASLRIADVHFVGFNPSPRGFYGPEVSSSVSRRWVYEGGEILAPLRTPWHFKIQKYQPLRYNFLDFIFLRSVTTVREHSMYLFSRGLLLAAIKGGNTEAARAFARNLDKPGFEQALLDADGNKPSAHDVGECRRIFDNLSGHR